MTKQNPIVRYFLISLFCLSAAWQSATFAADPEAMVNINTATAVQIAEKIKGIGIKKAEAIVEYRAKNGAFENLDQLMEIKGIGEKTLEKNREFLTL